MYQPEKISTKCLPVHQLLSGVGKKDFKGDKRLITAIIVVNFKVE